MNKRNATPLSVICRRKFYVKLARPRPRKYISDESYKFILPMIKDNSEVKNMKNNQSQKYIYHNNGIQKPEEKNRVIKNYCSPIKTELIHHNKRGSSTEHELGAQIKYKLLANVDKIDKTDQTSRITDKNSDKNLNKFNKSNVKKSNSIKSELLPSLFRCKKGKTDTNVKYPLFEGNSNQIIKSDKKINKKILKGHYKLKSDSLFDTQYNIEMKQFGTYSRKGFEDGKIKENNQDISIIYNDVCGIENYNIYGIMDGHGSNGHLVSNFVKEKIMEYFGDKKIYKKKKMSKSASFIDLDNTGKTYEKLIYNNYEIIRNFYKMVNDELYNTKFDVHFSGSTCVLVFKLGHKIICSNVGDSRAILVKKKLTLNKGDINDIKYEYVKLSYDHKPENKEERERIEKSGGEVAQEYLIDKQDVPVGPFRVWNKGCDYPGIAISRSLGDKIAELIGVISEPDILEFDIDDNCKYVIMGSDGLFDYLSIEDIMKIAGPSLIKHNPEKACFEVVEKAVKLFKEKENRIDDITINIIIL